MDNAPFLPYRSCKVRSPNMEADRAFARSTQANGAEGWASYFAEDGIMGGGQAVIVGRDSIRTLMMPAFADPMYSLSWEPMLAEVAASGELGYTLGRYERRRTAADGTVSSETGSYLTVWRREGGGEWRVALDIGSPDQEPEEDTSN